MGLTDYFMERLTQLAPVLILHGEADKVVGKRSPQSRPGSRSARTPIRNEALSERGTRLSRPEMLDASQRAYKFLKNISAAPEEGSAAAAREKQPLNSIATTESPAKDLAPARHAN